MNRSGAAPCQCHSPGGVWIVSPGRISSRSPPRAWIRPRPSVTKSVWPTAWTCQAFRAPGAKWTRLARMRDGSLPRAIVSSQTSPVNRSGGPFSVAGLGRISM